MAERTKVLAQTRLERVVDPRSAPLGRDDSRFPQDPKVVLSDDAGHESPAWINAAANMYVGMQTLMPTQSDAKCQRFHVRALSGVGRRSSLG